MRADLFAAYAGTLVGALREIDLEAVGAMVDALADARRTGRRVFICGNGGSAANALHLANDLVYGLSKNGGAPIQAIALAADISTLTCIANDISYDEIFSRQLAIHARAGDLLLVLSGSGNSPNVVRAIEAAKGIGMTCLAVLGYDGGRCRSLADVVLHFAADDMQVAEDLQLILGHFLMRALRTGDAADEAGRGRETCARPAGSPC